MHENPRSLIPLFTGALIFMIFALYNGYPIVNGDAGTYLESGYKLYVPAERPVFYGLFIRATSFGLTLWTTVFVQCLMLSYLCARFIRSLVPGIDVLHQLALILIIALGTIASWYAGQIMPDIFSPILFLAAYLYLAEKNSLWQKILLLTMVFIGTVVHNSHYVIATLFPLALILCSFIFKSRFGHFRQKAIHLGAIAMLGWGCLFTSNYIGGNGFVMGKASHVFLMGKLAESGVLRTYLEKACPVKDYKICRYKDNIPPVAWEFVWHENSPVIRAGGWDSVKAEYNVIIKDIMSRPKYWPFLAYKSIEATLRQVILLNIDEVEELHWVKFDKESFMYEAIGRYYPHELNEFEVDRQNIKTFNFRFYDEVYVTVLLLSTILCLFCLKGEDRKKALIVYTLVIGYIFINAFTTATFGNVLSRLNSRTVWLFPATNIVFLYRHFHARLTKGVKADYNP